jgi:hypothetical protein
MKQISLIIVSVLTLVNLSFADEQTVAVTGKQFCPASAKSPFQIGLERNKNLYLGYQKLSGAKVLMVLHYQTENSQCADILDAIQISASQSDFEFDCFDPAHPELIIIGELPPSRNDWNVRRTNHSWQIELINTRITTYAKPVTCKNASYAGDDDGEDLASDALKRAKSKISHQR